VSSEYGGAAIKSTSNRSLDVVATAWNEPPMPMSEIKLILDVIALIGTDVKLAAELELRMVQNTYALLVDRLSLGADALMLESPISASIRALLVINDNDTEVLKTPLMTSSDVSMIPRSTCTDFDMKILVG